MSIEKNNLTIPVKIDIRGFLRIQETVIKALNLPKTPYADLYIDRTNKRIAIVMNKKLNENSFRVIQNPASIIVYIKGAMNALGLSVTSGSYEVVIQDNKLIFNQPKTIKKSGEWERFACRNSAGLPMISIDTRGTLTLDRRTSEAINTQKNPTFTPEYNSKKKTFTLTFGQKGYMNVRTIESHANASFMGTLSSNGFSLPKKSFRTCCEIRGNVLTFRAEALKSKVVKASKIKKVK